jgi:hypothetical protein
MKEGKRRTSLVVDDGVFSQFKVWCDRRNISVSAFLNTQMRERIDNADYWVVDSELGYSEATSSQEDNRGSEAVPA